VKRSLPACLPALVVLQLCAVCMYVDDEGESCREAGDNTERSLRVMDLNDEGLVDEGLGSSFR
jgi:hypothetical protein